MRYLWLRSFNRTQRKIGAYSFAPQPFTSRVMSTIMVHAPLHPIRYIYIMFFPTCWACQRLKWKRKGEDHHDSCMRVEGKNKRYALRRGKQRLPCAFMVGCTKSQCERTSLYIAPCDMNLYYAVRRFYYFHITRSYKAYLSHTNQSYIFRAIFIALHQWQLTWRILLNP